MDPHKNRNLRQTSGSGGDNDRDGGGSRLRAIQKAGIKAEELDLIIAATLSADQILPGLACEVQSRIKATHATAFDLNAACSGFLFALDTAAMYIEQGYTGMLLSSGQRCCQK